MCGKGLPGEEKKDLGRGYIHTYIYIYIYIFFFFNNHIRKHLFEVSHEIKLKLHKHKSTLNRKPDSKGQSKNKEN